MQERRIAGEIHFDPPPAMIAGAVVRVRLEDVSLAGAPSRILAEQVLTGLTDEAVRAGLPFRLEAPPGVPGGAYTLSVHADLNADGVIGPGDYINPESCPVPPDGPVTSVVISARPVRAPRGLFHPRPA